MGDEHEHEQRGFTIVDRRGREAEEPEPAPEPAGAPTPPPHAASAEPSPPVDFGGLVLSLATSALYHLGQVADPETGRRAAPNPHLARQTIDTLELLEDKTRGNLTDEEKELLAHVLTDLRMRYVEATK